MSGFQADKLILFLITYILPNQDPAVNNASSEKTNPNYLPQNFTSNNFTAGMAQNIITIIKAMPVDRTFVDIAVWGC